jgi:hypothetical protein
LIVFVLASNISWISQDTSPSAGVDANFYLLHTLLFSDTLISQGIKQISSTIMVLSLDGRPPLFQLMSVPFILLFGRSMDSGLYVNLVFEILLLVTVYNIGKLVENGKAGLLAAIIVAGYPPLIDLSHIYRPHFALAACVALTVWMLLLLPKKRSIKIAWLFGLSIAFGLWIHPSFLWVAPIPAVILCLYIVFFQPNAPRITFRQLPAWFLGKMREPWVLYGLLPVSLISIVLILAWYLIGGDTLLSLMNTMNSPETIKLRGSEVITVGFGNARPSLLWYAITSPQTISTVLVALLGIGLADSLISRRFSRLLLLVFFVVGYAILSMQGALSWRYFAPLLPVAAVLSGTWIGRLKNRIISSVLIFFCVTTVILNIVIVTWGIHPWNRSVAFALGVPRNVESSNCYPDNATFCPLPPHKEKWPVDDILRSVLDDSNCLPENCDVLIINMTYYLNYSIFSLYSYQDFYETKPAIQSLGYLNGGIPFNLPALLNSEYIVYEDTQKIGKSQTYTAGALRFLRQPPFSFSRAHQEVAEFELPNGNIARLIKRVEPLTLNEALETIAAIDLPDKYKTMQYAVLAPLFEADGLWDKALISYYNIASTYETLGQKAQAAQAYQKVVEIAPDSEYAREARRWLDRYQK